MILKSYTKYWDTCFRAQVVELVDTSDSKSDERKFVRVQVPPWVNKSFIMYEFMKYIYMVILSVGWAFFVFWGISHNLFPVFIQEQLQPTTSATIRFQDHKKTIVQQSIREQRTVLEISDEIQNSIDALKQKSVYLNLPTTFPWQTSRQWIILSNDGLILILKHETGDQDVVQVTTHTDKTYTWSRYILQSPYFDLLELDLWTDVLSFENSFASLLSMPQIWEIIIWIQHNLDPGKISGQINIVSSSTWVRHLSQFNSLSPHTIYSRLNWDILWVNISWDGRTIFPINVEFIESVISEYLQLKSEAKPSSSDAAFTFPFVIKNQRSHIWNTVFGREIWKDISIDNKIVIWSWNVLTHLDGINIDTTIEPSTYSPLFYGDGVTIQYYSQGQKKSMDRMPSE